MRRCRWSALLGLAAAPTAALRAHPPTNASPYSLNALQASAGAAYSAASLAVQRSPEVAVGSFAAGVATGFAIAQLRDALEVYLTADDVPGGAMRKRRTLVGRVVKVTDGDTVRFRHTPSIFSRASFKGKLSENTIALRIAAVDTPETAKFGKPGQPFGEEATLFTKRRVLNRRVRVRCYSRDQYGRIVGTVTYGPRLVPFARRDLSTQLLKRGLASVYRSAGAIYGERALDGWSRIEERAQRRLLGMWSGGVGKASLPSDFKAKQRGK